MILILIIFVNKFMLQLQYILNINFDFNKKGGEIMSQRLISMNLPEDVLYEIDALHPQGQAIEGKLKLNLAIGLFVSKDISLGKASELAEKPLSEFVSILNHLNLPAVEYTDEMYDDDMKFKNSYKNKRTKS